jgi:hypothetical protein
MTLLQLIEQLELAQAEYGDDIDVRVHDVHVVAVGNGIDMRVRDLDVFAIRIRNDQPDACEPIFVELECQPHNHQEWLDHQNSPI